MQVSALDKIQLLRKPILKNRYKNLLSTCLATATIVLSNYSIWSLQIDRSQLFFYGSYGLLFFSTSIEVLLIIELGGQLQSKFEIVNLTLQQRKNLMMKQISKIMEIHHHLVMKSKQLNHTFSFPITVTVANNFYMTAEGLYYSLQLALIQKNIYGIFQLISTSLWTVASLVQILFIIKKFTDLSQEVSRN